MVIVAAGASERFGDDKLTREIDGRPLLWHTVNGVIGSVDRCVLVVRPDLIEWARTQQPEVEVVIGGATRTQSEIAGVDSLDDSFGLIGIHDGARPVVSEQLIEGLFVAADRVGGAIPVVPVEDVLVDQHGAVVAGAYRAQTPQVFRGAELSACLRAAAEEGYRGHDTADVVQRYSNLAITTVPGDETNVKVTFPEDLVIVEQVLRGLSRT
jgi:2-C-methyl-D-erythritol 4-phosphate cytidylyltransferase